MPAMQAPDETGGFGRNLGIHLTDATAPLEQRCRALRARAVASIAVLLALTCGVTASAAAGPTRTRTVALVNVNHRMSAGAVREAAAALQLRANEDLRGWWQGRLSGS